MLTYRSDTDGCYNTPAIDADGNVAEGLDHDNTGGADDCRDSSDLDNNSAYVPRGATTTGTTTSTTTTLTRTLPSSTLPTSAATGTIKSISWSSSRATKSRWSRPRRTATTTPKTPPAVRFEGERAKTVYHKDGGSTHAFPLRGREKR